MLGNKGQATVEFVIVFPLILLIACIALNALLMVSECSAFDRLARDEIRRQAYVLDDEERSVCSARVEDYLRKEFSETYFDVNVTMEDSGAFLVYVAELQYYPHLFGRNLPRNFFGVSLQPVKHQTTLAVSSNRLKIIDIGM